MSVRVQEQDYAVLLTTRLNSTKGAMAVIREYYQDDVAVAQTGGGG